MGSIGAMSEGSSDRYGQKRFKDKSKYVPEGVEGRVLYKGTVQKIIFQLKRRPQVFNGIYRSKEFR